MIRKDCKLYFSLIFYTLLPSIYLLIRMHIVTVQAVDIDILGQMEWFDLIDEVLVTTLTVPLYFLLKKYKEQTGAAFGLSVLLYTGFTFLIALNIHQISSIMSAAHAEEYLLVQSFAMLAGFVGTFSVLIFTLNGDERLIQILLICKLILLVLSDLYFIGRYQDVGAAYSEIAVNVLIGIVSVALAAKRGYLRYEKIRKEFALEWAKIGIFSGIQIFLDNYIYAVMVCKMVNEVSESGNYWVANNFIWGWLLIPVTCLCTVIQKNSLEKLSYKKVWKYVLLIIGLWLITMPGWKSFMRFGMSAGEEAVRIVFLIVPFYLAYMAAACIDAYFVSKGHTIYNAVNSFVVNIGYYGIVYLLYRKGILQMDIRAIVYMFGVGMVVHMLVSMVCYWWEIRKRG